MLELKQLRKFLISCKISMRLLFFWKSETLIRVAFKIYDARGGSPAPTRKRTPLKATFISVTPLPLTEATALAKPCKFGQSKA